MKKLLFCIPIFFAAQNLKAERDPVYLRNQLLHASPDTVTYPIANLSAFDWASYLNRPINELLAELDNSYPGYIVGTVYANERLRMAARINIYYGQGRALILSVSHFQLLNPYSQDGGPWDVDLFKQEKISAIELWNNTVCVYNSNP